jgi:hypothetical protein
VAAKKIVRAKDVAVDAVSHATSEVGSRARNAAGATVSFLSANALPLTLLGLGAGWLAYAVQQRRRRNHAVLSSALRDEPLPARSADSRQWVEEGREKLAAFGNRAAENMQHLGDRARAMSHDAMDGIVAAEQRAVALAKEHPVATSAAAVAAGVGIAMAIPGSPLENKVLGPVRDKLEGDARAAFDEVKSGVQSALETATEIKNDLVAKATR